MTQTEKLGFGNVETPSGLLAMKPTAEPYAVVKVGRQATRYSSLSLDGRMPKYSYRLRDLLLGHPLPDGAWGSTVMREIVLIYLAC